MALNPFSLADAFESAWKKHSPNEMIPAKKIAKALSQFIDTGQTAMMGVPKSAPGTAQLAVALKDAWKSQLPDSFLVAKKEAAAIHQMVMATTTSGGKHGTGGFMSGSEALMANDFSKLYKDRMPKERLIALKKAKIIDSYLKSCMYRGSGVGPDWIPDISSLT